jgi:hypothetical protein
VVHSVGKILSAIMTETVMTTTEWFLITGVIGALWIVSLALIGNWAKAISRNLEKIQQILSDTLQRVSSQEAKQQAQDKWLKELTDRLDRHIENHP